MSVGAKDMPRWSFWWQCFKCLSLDYRSNYSNILDSNDREPIYIGPKYLPPGILEAEWKIFRCSCSISLWVAWHNYSFSLSLSLALAETAEMKLVPTSRTSGVLLVSSHENIASSYSLVSLFSVHLFCKCFRQVIFHTRTACSKLSLK